MAELEQLQDGMYAYIGGPMNSRRGGRRGRGRGRGRGGWRGNADLGRLIGQHTVGDDYEVRFLIPSARLHKPVPKELFSNHCLTSDVSTDK